MGGGGGVQDDDSAEFFYPIGQLTKKPSESCHKDVKPCHVRGKCARHGNYKGAVPLANFQSCNLVRNFTVTEVALIVA